MILLFYSIVYLFAIHFVILSIFPALKKHAIPLQSITCFYIFIYQIYGDGAEKGILTNYKGDNSDTLIKEVNKRLMKRPFEDSYGVSILLRRAVEKIIDEEVFKHQLPPRVSNKNSRINWEELKSINSKPDLVDRLRAVHDTTSEEDHVGTASSENPITVDKLKDLSNELTRIKEDFKS